MLWTGSLRKVEDWGQLGHSGLGSWHMLGIWAGVALEVTLALWEEAQEGAQGRAGFTGG